MRNLFLSALFAASLLFTACSSGKLGNSNKVANSSPSPSPATYNSPAKSNLDESLHSLLGNEESIKLIGGKIETYKKEYKSEPEEANKKFNLALKDIRIQEVKDKLLEIKDIAFNEVAQSQPEQNFDSEELGKELERIIKAKIDPIDRQLDTISQKVAENDSSRIPIVILVQSGFLGLILVAGFVLIMHQLQKSSTTVGKQNERVGMTYNQAPSNPKADESPGSWNRNPAVYPPPQDKQKAENNLDSDLSKPEDEVDLPKIEKLLGELIDSVGCLPQQIIDAENSISKKIDNYRRPISESSAASQNVPSVKNEITVPTIFKPTLVKELKDQYQGRSRALEKDQFSDLLIPSFRDETFLLIENKSNAQIFRYIIPNKERFRKSEDYFNIQAYFDCENAGAGELLVEKPAMVDKEGDGWKLLRKGKISIQ
ncbi:MAG: hypothetical protein LUM44_06300 [Pyrinomonadaceae bacterium]|nr:hypothetical protein [Pyrinomonadaceae bacterium]